MVEINNTIKLNKWPVGEERGKCAPDAAKKERKKEKSDWENYLRDENPPSIHSTVAVAAFLLEDTSGFFATRAQSFHCELLGYLPL